MQRYDTYKNSGVKWLGEIPSHWDAVRVKHLFIVSRGRVIAADQMNDEGEYPVYSSQTENNGCMGYISTYDYEGDVLTWTTDGAKAGTVFRRRGKFNCTNVCGVLTPITNNHLGYLYYAIYLAAYYNKRVDILGYKIMSNEMAELKFPLPPFKEQTAIANYLNTATAKIDAAIAQQQKMIDLLNERKQIIINRAVTKGLNPNAKMKDSGVEWIGEVPEGWEMNKFKNLYKTRTGITFTKAELVEFGERVISYGQIHSKENWRASVNPDLIRYIPMSLTEGKSGALAEKGDFLFADTSEDFEGCGNNVYIDTEEPIYAGYHTILAKCNNNQCGAYLAYLFASTKWRGQIRSMVNGVKVYSITQSIIKNASVILPSVDEQKAIADYIKNRVIVIDKAIKSHNQKISLLQERKQIIINEVVTGKVKVG